MRITVTIDGAEDWVRELLERLVPIASVRVECAPPSSLEGERRAGEQRPAPDDPGATVLTAQAPAPGAPAVAQSRATGAPRKRARTEATRAADRLRKQRERARVRTGSDPVTQAIIERDGAGCRYCRSAEDLTIDHVVPLSKGGTNDLSNLCLACRPCNSSKGERVTVWGGRSVTHA